MPLSDLKCRNAKPGPKSRKMTDGGWLYLLIQPNGSKHWRMGYRTEGKEKTLSFGRYPAVSLADARQKREEAKEALVAGRDPSVKSGEKSPFKEVSEEWLAARSDNWAPVHARMIRRRMVLQVYPEIGHVPIASIDAPMLLKCLRKIEHPDVARRAHQTISQVLRYAVATGRATRDSAQDLKGALPPPPKVSHMAKLSESELPEFIRKLRAFEGDQRASIALELIMHTFVRSKELLGGRWSEIESDVWRIPKERMKSGREHLVPLVPQTKVLFQRLRDLSDDDRICPLSVNTMIRGIYRMGYQSRATVHGFRGTASTALNESGLWSVDAIERQLAHVPGGVRAAYNNAQYLPERRRMLEWWSNRLQIFELEPCAVGT